MDGVRLVSAAALGIDCENIIVGGEVYTIFPPTIKKLCGAGYYLADLGNCKTITEMISNMKSLDDSCKALSWLIRGDESLAKALSEGTLEELTKGLSTALEMVGITNFPKLSGLARSVRSLIATTR